MPKGDARHSAADHCQDCTYTADSHKAYVSHDCYLLCCSKFRLVVRHCNVVELVLHEDEALRSSIIA